MVNQVGQNPGAKPSSAQQDTATDYDASQNAAAADYAKKEETYQKEKKTYDIEIKKYDARYAVNKNAALAELAQFKKTNGTIDYAGLAAHLNTNEKSITLIARLYNNERVDSDISTSDLENTLKTTKLFEDFEKLWEGGKLVKLSGEQILDKLATMMVGGKTEGMPVSPHAPIPPPSAAEINKLNVARQDYDAKYAVYKDQALTALAQCKNSDGTINFDSLATYVTSNDKITARLARLLNDEAPRDEVSGQALKDTKLFSNSAGRMSDAQILDKLAGMIAGHKIGNRP